MFLSKLLKRTSVPATLEKKDLLPAAVYDVVISTYEPLGLHKDTSEGLGHHKDANPRNEAGKKADLMAKELLAQAREKAAGIEQEAREKMKEWEKLKVAELDARGKRAEEEGFKSGYQQGQTAGLIEGRQQAEHEWTEKLEEVGEIVAAAMRMRQVFFEEAEAEVVRLACAIAEKVLGQMMAEQAELFVAMVKHCLAQFPIEGRVILTVHPRRLPELENILPELKNTLSEVKVLEVKSDFRMEEDDCLIQTPASTVDASLKTQLTSIKHHLLALEKGGRHDEHFSLPLH